MTTIRVLHLSDFHAGQGEQRRLYPHYRQQILEDLEKVTKRVPVDAVIFSGDLTQRGTAEEFALFDKEFAAIAKALPARSGAPPVLLAVPGNHDLARPTVNATVRALRGLWDGDAELRAEFWGHTASKPSDARAVIEKSFEPYTTWWKTKLASMPSTVSVSSGALPGDFAATVALGGLRVGVIGLNSAWLQLTGDDFEGKLDVDVAQLNAAIGSDAGDWFNEHDFALLVTHHPPSWLSKRSLDEFRQFVAPPGRFALHLFGHMHEPQSLSVGHNGLPDVHWMQAPSLFGMESIGGRIERILGYTLIEFDASGAQGVRRFWPRRATKVGPVQRLNPDTSFALDADNAVKASFVVRRSKPSTTASAPPATVVAPTSTTIVANVSAESERALRVALAMLYSQSQSARRLCSDAGIDVSRVDFNGAAVDIWFSAVSEARNSGRLAALFLAARAEYPNSPALGALVAAFAAK